MTAPDTMRVTSTLEPNEGLLGLWHGQHWAPLRFSSGCGHSPIFVGWVATGFSCNRDSPTRYMPKQHLPASAVSTDIVRSTVACVST